MSIAGDLEVVYKNRFSLAQYFQGRDDKWLSDHFFQTCLDVASQDATGQQRLCEALCHVGLALEENGRINGCVTSICVTSRNFTLGSLQANCLMRLITLRSTIDCPMTNGIGEQSSEKRFPQMRVFIRHAYTQRYLIRCIQIKNWHELNTC